MSEAGENSPHLDEKEQKQAAEAAALGPLVIHEIVREQGETELKRPFSGLAWSGLAAGASIGFSFMMMAVLQGALPDAPWSRLVSSFGYSLGFLIVILGQQQLFTETTLTALIPTLTRRDLASLLSTLRVWSIVLVANLIGTVVFGTVSARAGAFRPETLAAMQVLSDHTMDQPFWTTTLKAGGAGWLIGLMVWLLPAAGSAKTLIVVLLTYTVAAAGFNHIVAGSTEAVFGVATGHASVGDYFLKFFIPTLLGNTIGGTVLVGLLNHAPVASEIFANKEQDATR
jgi:formate/nitrite transporter FocA (FNT family)